VGRMVCAIFDEDEISPEFRDVLHDRTEGNPFVIEEMLKNALDRGDIFKKDSGWDRKSVAELGLGIPPTVSDSILLRIERMTPEAAEVIAAASVVGRSFDLATLVALTGRDEATVTSALQACVLNQLLEEDDPQAATYRFRHALTREGARGEQRVGPGAPAAGGRHPSVGGGRPDGGGGRLPAGARSLPLGAATPRAGPAGFRAGSRSAGAVGAERRPFAGLYPPLR